MMRSPGIPRIGFIGAGTVGNALARLLSQKGYPVIAVYSRTADSAQKLAESVKGCRAVSGSQYVAEVADLVFITTPDDAIVSVVYDVRWHKGQSVVHCSGADSTAILEPAREMGARVGAFHPLQTFATVPRAIENIPGSTFAIEAEEPLLTTLQKMAEDLGGRWIELKPEDRIAYHAAAVIACNYLVTLAKIATDLWQTFDVPPNQAIEALLPLIKGTVHNIETAGIPQCLTGPIARGDIGTIRKHLATLQEKAPALLTAYKELGSRTIPIALAKGRINNKQARALECLLKKGALRGADPRCRV